MKELNYEEKCELIPAEQNQLKQNMLTLAEFGFTDFDKNKEALIKHKNNVELACNDLM